MSRELTPDELLFIVRVQRDAIASLLDQIADTQRRVIEAYQDGQMRGAELAEQDMAAHWASIVRDARAHISGPTFAERRAAELEWAKPRPGDYTGQLTPDEYFGDADQPQEPNNVHPLERRHAA